MHMLLTSKYYRIPGYLAKREINIYFVSLQLSMAEQGNRLKI